MKFTIGVSAIAATAIANICDQQCGSYCADEGGEALTNWDNAGFEDSAECQAHPCSATWNGVDDAKWRECEEGARELEERKYNHIVKMAKSQMTTKHSLRTVFRMLQNYGCHCFPGQTREAGGHGPAVDAQDSLCKDLARCHRCVELDHGKDVIDVDHGKYRFNVVNGAISCERNTLKGWHQSKRDLCECDARFANEIGKIWNDDTFNDYYWLHPKQMKLISKGKLEPEPSKFDIVSTCDAPHGGKADSCCGGFPERYPFDSSEKACCENTVSYNSITQACCEDGTIGSIGDC
jgi:hypothetical protein